MARYGSRAPYRGKGQKAIGARLARAKELGYKFTGLGTYADFNDQPQVTAPDGSVIVERGTIGLRRAVVAVEKLEGITASDNAHLCDRERKPGGPVPHTAGMRQDD